jgi:hypothetical protein
VQEGEVAGGGAVAHAAVVLAEGDVEHPMQRVLDAPVPADGLDQGGGLLSPVCLVGQPLALKISPLLPEGR